MTRAAGEAYQLWLGSDPVNRPYVGPDIPRECYTTWARVEQRGQSMLLGALPEGLKGEVLSTRSTNTVEILYRIYVRYQPGGLGEKTLLLRKLVDGKTAGGPSEFVEQVRGWKRNLRRAQELNVTTPDPTLLMGALDKMSSTIIKTSSQMAFRLNSTRAQLMVDINLRWSVSPTMPTPLWERLRDFFMLEFKLRPLPRSRRLMVELWKPQLRGMERERAQTSQAELRLASSLGLMMDVKRDRTAPTSTIGRLWTRRALLDAAQPSTQGEIALSGL